ncbi:phosphate uptake regulator PhoU [Candidatus Micrarchaeota archaeon]|nr:phosphate uptake regulator PhoU [Candidatus Micrarchaeota archaeon]
METRKVQKTGRSTFIVSLPKAWAEGHGLSRGAAVGLEENPDGSLQIMASPVARTLQAQVDAENALALRSVISAYIAGAQDILLSGKNAAGLAQQARDHLAAVDVVFEEKERVTLRVFATGHEYSLEQLLRRMHAVVKSLFALAHEGNRDAVLRREQEVNRLYTLALRSMGAGARHAEFKFDALVAKGLESIADELKALALEGGRAKAALEKLEAAYDAAMNQFFSGEPGGKATEAVWACRADLDKLQGRDPLSWARLEAVARHCVEIEETTADLAAIRTLSKQEKG